MERTAFARTSNSQFQTVTTTVFQLDPGDVIRAKDRQEMAQQMSRSEEGCASTSVQGQASTSQVGTKTLELSSKHQEPMQEAGQAPSFKNMPLEEDSSQIAKIARLATATNTSEAATEHAIPGIRHIQSESISDLTKDIRIADDQALEPSAALSVSDNDPSHQLSAAIDTYTNPAQSNSKRNDSSKVVRNGVTGPKATRRNRRTSHSPARASLQRSRPRRSARKTYISHRTADVDWSEGIRPTDDEKPPNNTEKANKTGASRETSVDSPEAASEKSSRNKRKAPKVKSDSAKRQKATKKNTSIKAQLPLITTIDGRCQPEVNKAHAHSFPERILNERRDIIRTGDALDMLTASFPSIDKREKLEVVRSKNQIIELSSESLLQNNQSSPRQCTNSRKSNGKIANTDSRGRGVTVGKKLTDALRDAGLNRQYPPDLESRFPPTQISVGRSAFELPRSHSTLPNQVFQAQNSFSSELGMVKDESSATYLAKKQICPSEPDEILATSTHTNQMAGVSLGTVGPPAVNLSVTQKLLHIPQLWGRKDDGDDAGNPMVIPDDSSVAHLSDAMGMNLVQLTNAAQNEPQMNLQLLEDEIETSSLSSEIPPAVGITMLQRSESDRTPESQKPLLSVYTRPQQIAPLAVPKSIARSSIVDHNGSPRLCPQTDITTMKSRLNIDHFISQNIRIVDSSSSEYGGDPDGYSPKSKYLSGGRWSKFQRDMFMEYGIGPEELTTEKTGRALFEDAVKVASRTNLISNATTADITESQQEAEGGNYILVGSATSNARASGISSGFIPRSIDDPQMEASHDAQNYEKRLSAIMQSDPSNMKWITDLQAAQQSAHNHLLETNQYLSSQLAAEHDTIRQVLKIYRQGYNRILDDLFPAQEVRMQLYRQQMASVQEQHTLICQEMIQGLQELDHRVQQRLEGGESVFS